MLTIKARQILFFSLLLLGFFIGFKLVNYWISKGTMDKDIVLSISSLFFVMFSIAIYYIASLDKMKESFWEISPELKCGSSDYFWQGDSQFSKQCRALASTPEGKCALDSTSCNDKALLGRPGLGFVYTPISNGEYKNERCENLKSCNCGQDSQKPWQI